VSGAGLEVRRLAWLHQIREAHRRAIAPGLPRDQVHDLDHHQPRAVGGSMAG